MEPVSTTTTLMIYGGFMLLNTSSTLLDRYLGSKEANRLNIINEVQKRQVDEIPNILTDYMPHYNTCRNMILKMAMVKPLQTLETELTVRYYFGILINHVKIILTLKPHSLCIMINLKA